MRVLTEELEGETLSIAVALCEGLTLMRRHDYFLKRKKLGAFIDALKNDVVILRHDSIVAALGDYTTSWALAGPIIERAEISLRKEPSGGWYAFKNFSTCEATPFTHCSAFDAGGETALVAAMRCYVLSKRGDEADVPDELVGGGI